MSLRFYFGASGAGKSTSLHKEIVGRAMAEPDTNFFVIVPDQFTMQTQMDLVKAHPSRGIMNIDVLSFGRLSHRILEEVGANARLVLDDTGKSLILRKVAEGVREDLDGHASGSGAHSALFAQKAPLSHTHSPGQITAGTFGGMVTAQSNTSYETAQVRNISLSPEEPSGGNNGQLWFKYTT